MQAITFTQYGSPDLLKLEEVEKPTPQANEVLIRVRAASVNPLDWHTIRADPFLVRLSGGFLRPKTNRLGVDVAGTVESVGRNVTDFRPGDQVFGESHFGSLGEFVCAAENKLVKKPSNLSFPQAAAVPVAAITALQSLNARGQVQAGQNVLVNGASGGVGTFTVQLAKTYGAQVTAVCSTRNIELVRSLGADHVIDYTREDFTASGKTYDLIIDNVGNHSVSDLRRALKPRGNGVIVGFTSMSLLLQAVLLGPRASKNGGPNIGLMSIANVTKKDMQFLSALLEAKKIEPVIDRCYPLDQAPEAIRYLETKHARAKVVVVVQEND